MVRKAWVLLGQRLDAQEMYQLQRSLALGDEDQCVEPVHGPQRNGASCPRVDESGSPMLFLMAPSEFHRHRATQEKSCAFSPRRRGLWLEKITDRSHCPVLPESSGF